MMSTLDLMNVYRQETCSLGMVMQGFERNVAGISVLAEPVRRELYQFICSQPEPVSRDQAAQALGIARHQAKFHLDRLEAEGLLEADYVRLTGRTGPGAGRPAKRYRRAGGEFAITLPAREYELAGHILAEAIVASAQTGTPTLAALSTVAATYGATIAGAVPDRPSTAENALDLAVSILSRHAYEPRRIGSAVVMANCPFHALARSHTELVCGMNLSVIAGFVRSVAPDLLDVRLDPDDNRCCVTLNAIADGQHAAHSESVQQHRA
jgi:predicted ArsR family transcriptional regulator